MRRALVIDNWHPHRLNELMSGHWTRRHRLKKEDRTLVVTYALLRQIPIAEGKRRVSLTITLEPRQRGGDPDAYWKSLLDALVHAGLLVDDTPKYVELGPVRFERGQKRKTTIHLSDVSSPPSPSPSRRARS